MPDPSKAKAFREYCQSHAISEMEGIICALDLVIPETGGRRAWYAPVEVRGFQPEVLEGMFDLDEAAIGRLLERAVKVEEAHRLWQASFDRPEATYTR